MNEVIEKNFKISLEYIKDLSIETPNTLLSVKFKKLYNGYLF